MSSLAMKRMSKSYPILKATQIRIAKSILDILIIMCAHSDHLGPVVSKAFSLNGG